MLDKGISMSNFMLPDLDRETGCCSCLAVLRKSDKPVDYSHHLTNRFSHKCLLNDCRGDSTTSLSYAEGAAKSYSSKDCKKLPSFVEKGRIICREVPVKETTGVRRSRYLNGNKMINEYVRQSKIGSGSYGKVVLYRSIINGELYAIKRLKSFIFLEKPKLSLYVDINAGGSQMEILWFETLREGNGFYKSRLSKVRVAPSETAMTDILREVSIMKMLQHPNIVNLVEVMDHPESDYLYMVLEYVEGKEVCDASGTAGGIGERYARRYFRDIIAGVMYLHDHNVVHADIKPENLLVTGSGVVKIADFNVSHVFEDNNDELWRSPGTPAFTPPECCSGLPYHGKAADTWAVGATLYCMVLGYWPFIGDSLQDTYDKILNTPLPLPADLDPELKNLLQGLLCKDPMLRSTIQSVAEDPWVVREGGIILQNSCRCKRSIFLRENPHEN